MSIVDRRISVIETPIEPFIANLIKRGENGKAADRTEFTGLAANQIFQRYSRLLRWYSQPMQTGRMVEPSHDPSQYIAGEYHYGLIPLEGLVRGKNFRVGVSLRSADIYHPLAFHPDQLLDRRDWMVLRLIQNTPSEHDWPEHQTTFHFYPEHFDRTDDYVEGVSSQVIKGDKGDLIGVARLLARLYRDLAEEV